MMLQNIFQTIHIASHTSDYSFSWEKGKSNCNRGKSNNNNINKIVKTKDIEKSEYL